MEKISKVKSVQGAGTWDGQHGLFYKFDYEFEDGVSLQALHKSDKPFDVGEEVSYLIKKETEYGKSGKVSKPQQEFKPKTKGGNASFALSYSKDLAIAKYHAGGELSTDEILAVADKFNDWLNSH